MPYETQENFLGKSIDRCLAIGQTIGMSTQQKPKPRMSKTNPEFHEATITRHAASARRRPLATDYRRKPKHPKKGWE